MHSAASESADRSTIISAQGIALGSYITELRDAAPLRSKLIMAAVFVLTVPVGTWIGIGVASSYDPESVTALWVTGSLNAITGAKGGNLSAGDELPLISSARRPSR